MARFVLHHVETHMNKGVGSHQEVIRNWSKRKCRFRAKGPYFFGSPYLMTRAKLLVPTARPRFLAQLGPAF
jgi:hypothetical protein